MIDAGGSEHLLTQFDAKYDELAATSDATTLVATQLGLDSISFVRVTVPDGHETLLFSDKRVGRAAHPAWSEMAKAVLFQRGPEIWSLQLDGTLARLSTIGAAK
jgi:hypothetical protein